MCAKDEEMEFTPQDFIIILPNGCLYELTERDVIRLQSLIDSKPKLKEDALSILVMAGNVFKVFGEMKIEIIFRGKDGEDPILLKGSDPFFGKDHVAFIIRMIEAMGKKYNF